MPRLLFPRKVTRYPQYRRPDGLRRSVWVLKISPPPPGFDLRTVQTRTHFLNRICYIGPFFVCKFNIIFIETKLNFTTLSFITEILKQCFCFGNRRYLSEAKPSYSAKRDTPTIRTHCTLIIWIYTTVGLGEVEGLREKQEGYPGCQDDSYRTRKCGTIRQPSQISPTLERNLDMSYTFTQWHGKTDEI